MFIQNLNSEQQGLMLSLAKKLISVDGQISTKETDMLATLETQCDENISENKGITMSELKNIFKTEREKASVMLELIAVAYADDDYHKSEQKLLKEITIAIDLNKSKLTDMENWVKRQIILAKESELFMED